MEKSGLLDMLLPLVDKVPQLAGFSGENAAMDEIGDGNMNFVYRVRWDESSVIVKHTPAYVKCLGPQYALTANRLKVEFDALGHFHAAAPGLCPQPYWYDEKTSTMVMADLKTFSGMRSQIVEGTISVPAVCDVARFAARIHRHYHINHLGKDEWDRLCNDFANADLVDITRQFLFLRPFNAEDPTNKSPEITRDLATEMRANEVLQANVADLRKKFLEQKECLLHGDLHSGSVMVDGDRARVIDAEFACVGPAAFEIGMYLIQFCVTWLALEHACQVPDCSAERKREIQTTAETCIGHVWETYTSEFFGADANESLLSAMWNDALGFGACEATRRVIGAAPIPDLSTSASLLAVLRFCFKLLTERDSIKTVSQLVGCVKSCA